MKTILLREVPDDLHARLVASAETERRSMEKEALRRLELSFQGPLSTCGELADWLASEPPPPVKEKDIDAVLSTRGRRSARP